jgi:hypothetical protein
VPDHVIKSAEGGAVLELRNMAKSGTFHVRLRGNGFDGLVEVYAYEPPLHLAAFFRDLATHWRGWLGEKRWESLEHQLSLRGKSDSLGHTRLLVELTGGPEWDWRLSGPILLEAGQLEQLAADVESFVKAAHAA